MPHIEIVTNLCIHMYEVGLRGICGYYVFVILNICVSSFFPVQKQRNSSYFPLQIGLIISKLILHQTYTA